VVRLSAADGGAAAIFLNPTASNAPSVSGVTVNTGAAQRSKVTTLAVTFSTAVPLLPGAFGLKRVGLPGGAAGDNAAVGTQAVNGVTVATLTFGGANTTAGSLDDGNWTLTVDHTKVQSASGAAPMAADFTQANIKRLFGDGDGSGVVDALDLFRLRTSFGKTGADPGFLAYFDFDGSGTVDALDLFQFRTRFGVTI
jgi:hypothetical protein